MICFLSDAQIYDKQKQQILILFNVNLNEAGKQRKN